MLWDTMEKEGVEVELFERHGHSEQLLNSCIQQLCGIMVVLTEGWGRAHAGQGVLSYRNNMMWTIKVCPGKTVAMQGSGSGWNSMIHSTTLTTTVYQSYS